MCRMAAWSGAAQPLSALLYDAPHSLEHQSFAPESMLSGRVNVDGTGVAWWPTRGAGEPLCYRSERPPWSDGNLQRLTPRLTAQVQLLLVRSATLGQGMGEAAVGPFTGDGLALAHNGFVEHWQPRARRVMLALLDDDLFARSRAGTDSEVLFLHMLQRRRELPAAPIAELLAVTLERFRAELAGLGVAARLDVLASDGEEVAAARCSLELASNTLFMGLRGDGIAFASEPLDPAWGFEPLPPNEVVATHGVQTQRRPLV